MIEDENELLDLVEREPSQDELRDAGLRCAVFMRGQYVEQLRADAETAGGVPDADAVAAFYAWRARTREDLLALYDGEPAANLLRRAADCGIKPESLQGVPAESLLAAVVDRALAVALSEHRRAPTVRGRRRR
jgi:hypothetical protein